MILLDTNIVIDMINEKNNSAWELFQKEDIVLCGVVIAELSRGFRNRKRQPVPYQRQPLYINSSSGTPPETLLRSHRLHGTSASHHISSASGEYPAYQVI